MSFISRLMRLAMVTGILAGTAGLVFAQPSMAASTSCLPGSLKAKLSQIRAKFGPISVVSAHRPGARIAGSGKRSYHASCRAVDFLPPKGKYRQVVAWLKANHSGGVGTYSCGMHHIHIDDGPRVRFHHCVTASGRPVGKSRYAGRKSKRTYAGKSKSTRYAAKSGKSKAMVRKSGGGSPSYSAASRPALKQAKRQASRNPSQYMRGGMISGAL